MPDQSASNTQPIKAGFIYFALVFAAGFLLGSIREVYLVPRFGPMAAVLIEVPVMLAVSWNACGIVLRHVPVEVAFAPRLTMGTAAFVFLMLSETALATLALEKSVPLGVAQFSSAHGAIGLAGQALFALVPIGRLAVEPRRPPTA